MGRGASTEWDVVLDEQAAMGKAAFLMREQHPQGQRLIAFTIRVATSAKLAFLSDAKSMAKHFGFTAVPWDRFNEGYVVVRFHRVIS